MSRSSSGIVAGLTGAALVTVGFLAYQASANAPDSLAAPKPSVSASAPAHPGGTPKKPHGPAAVPPHSGTGTRVVYSLSEKRVWLVSDSGTRTFKVMPSTVNPPVGIYGVQSRSGNIPGSDGVRIEHVVRFASVNGVTIGFSAAVDGSMASPDPTQKTGGIRMSREDGDAMWPLATYGTKVVVVL
ncbi:hypothetical protein OG204_22855 [Streptomyces sp. NBC_01387]|uniref:hypothetical protein n=1 Tax=unclassified Streptomyces TaxID=2593676 RepID=UPI00202455A1|nr:MULTISPECIES: hypothetical protein [unclassified Streptomyces]MCX4548836.1 hypothetical protein [Streptomyces sp. NBC_01500]WSC20421.1 hypothetical protein OIE60_12395 [Streptomyces sp. NBC_01766]WSV54454.1 hypothetical protein OG282_12455 [Streptomyces sp. NBC_01014]